MRTIVFQFGLRRPTEGLDAFREQLRLTHLYRNDLIEIERFARQERRDLYSQTLGAFELAVNETGDAAKKLHEALKTMRSHSIKSATASHGELLKELTQQLKVAREAHKEAKAKLSEQRRALRESGLLNTKLEEIFNRCERNKKQVYHRKYKDLYWGNRQVADVAFQASLKEPDGKGGTKQMPIFDGVKPRDPWFRRWTGEGKCRTQIIGGVLSDLVEAGTTQIKLIKTGCSKGGRRVFAELSIRIGTQPDGRTPVWLRCPMVYHRQIPSGSIIKLAEVSCRREGPREYWTAEITAEIPDVEARCGSGHVAIDIGWRPIGDEIRVARWFGSDGRSGEWRLSAYDISGIGKADELRGTRDKAQDLMKLRLTGFFREAGLELIANTIEPWKRNTKFYDLLDRWKAWRFDGDQEGFELLAEWKKQDLHLWKWEGCQRRKALSHRLNRYRRFGAALAKEYQTVIWEDFDLREVATVSHVNQESAHRSIRFSVAPSILRMAVSNAFTSRGGFSVDVPCANSTKECHKCHSIETWDAAANLRRTCSSCGAEWDQDDNAARNLCERWDGELPPVTARGEKREGRWARVKREKRERELAATTEETARDADSNAAE